jgi:hypothetical protein
VVGWELAQAGRNASAPKEQTEVRMMSLTVTREAPAKLKTAAPLIELADVQKIYRTGKRRAEDALEDPGKT